MHTGLIQCIFFTFLRCSFTGRSCLADNTPVSCFLNSSFSLNRTTGCIFAFLRCSFTGRGCLADNTPVSCFLMINSSSFSLNRTTGTFTLDYSSNKWVSAHLLGSSLLRCTLYIIFLIHTFFCFFGIMN